MRLPIIAMALALATAAQAQQPPAPLYAITLSMQLSLTGKQVSDLVNALAGSEIAARIAVPMINDISAQIGAQNEAMAAARRVAEDAAKARAAEEAAKAKAEKAPNGNGSPPAASGDADLR